MNWVRIIWGDNEVYLRKEEIIVYTYQTDQKYAEITLKTGHKIRIPLTPAEWLEQINPYV